MLGTAPRQLCSTVGRSTENIIEHIAHSGLLHVARWCFRCEPPRLPAHGGRMRPTWLYSATAPDGGRRLSWLHCGVPAVVEYNQVARVPPQGPQMKLFILTTENSARASPEVPDADASRCEDPPRVFTAWGCLRPSPPPHPGELSFFRPPNWRQDQALLGNTQYVSSLLARQRYLEGDAAL
jgi:hypothetical protein